ncbi:MAG: pilin [Candidatus Uhrbacteria bacterium]
MFATIPSNIPTRVVVALVVVGIVLSFASVANAATDPQLDSRCWPQADCVTVRGSFEPSPDCPLANWGHCYAEQRPIKLGVSIGEVGEVKDIGHYIATAYRYAIPVAAIFAVVAIMIGGIIWMTSGGVGDFSRAKTIIFNAIIGLVLVMGSYVTLKTINPDLVQLQLPRTMVLRPIALGSAFCSNVSADVPIHFGGSEAAIVSRETRSQLPCGQKFATPTAPTRTCIGDHCPSNNQACVPKGSGSYGCIDGVIGGEVAGDGDAFPRWVMLDAACANGKKVEATVPASLKEVTAERLYSFSFAKNDDWRNQYFDEIARQCEVGNFTQLGSTTSPNLLGFFFNIQVEATGFNDYFAVGQQSCGGSSRPIVVNGEDNPSDIDWARVDASELIPPITIFRALRGEAPFRCNLSLTRTNFRNR